MSGTSTDASHSDKQNTDDKNKAAGYNVSMPSIVLTRIDEVQVPVKKTTKALKKRAKNIEKKISKTKKADKNSSENPIVKRPRGRPKKQDLPGKVANLKTKINSVKKLGTTSKISAVKISPKKVKVNSDVKNMLKKTMLQKRSKIAIPPAKKSKLTTPKKPKALPPKKEKQIKAPKIKADILPKIAKPISPKPKLNVLPTKTVDTDSSEDEFLYDELIEELENTSNKQSGFVQSVLEKTTNITLKPNIGNKPPTVVKGGIIKRVNLPADLKPIASPSNLNNSTSGSSLLPDTAAKVALSGRKTKLPNSSDSPNPVKKPSPWPISISSPIKSSVETPPTKKEKKLGPKDKINTTPSILPGKPKNVPKTPKVTPQPLLMPTKSTVLTNVHSKPVSLAVGRPKMGPKQTAKVVPISKSLNEDDNLSDEYTEEETLENYDSEPMDTVPKLDDPMKNYKSLQENGINTQTPSKLIVPCFDDPKDDEDPHLDLLRILTDDTEEPVLLQTFESKGKNVHSINHSSSNTSDIQRTVKSNPSPETTIIVDQNTVTANEVEEEPKARTIYDLMNEISLQYPSWNLHIIPETNAFCIAQVTKGRLGLPTLKKCIELDPVDYNAKVYIHQYHIKRFNGVYDSEESIIALIHEINSIKA